MYHQLRSFISAAELKSLSAVAKKLFLTQPAITQHIKFLESQLGVKLIRRAGGSMELTPEGRRLYNEAKEVVVRMGDLKNIFSSADTTRLTIDFSTIDSVTLSILPTAIKKFRSKNKNIHLIPHVEASSPAISDLQKEEIDIALCTIDDLPDDIAGEMLFKERLVLIAPRKEIDIVNERLILFPASSRTRALIDKTIKDNKIPMAPDIETIKVSAIIAFVEAGLGISIVPYYSAHKELRSGRICEIPLKKTRTRSVGVAYKKNKTLAPIILEFIKILREESKKLMNS